MFVRVSTLPARLQSLGPDDERLAVRPHARAIAIVRHEARSLGLQRSHTSSRSRLDSAIASCWLSDVTKRRVGFPTHASMGPSSRSRAPPSTHGLGCQAGVARTRLPLGVRGPQMVASSASPIAFPRAATVYDTRTVRIS